VELSTYISFLIISSVLIVVPGPNVLLIVTTALVKGRRRGVQTIAGTLVAISLQLLIAAKGTVWLAESLSEFFQVFKWIGAGYLTYVGVSQLRAAINPDKLLAQEISSYGTFARGFFVGITNPKTILFFGAFLPQFTSANQPIEPQLLLLSVSFLVLALFFDSVYLLIASVMSRLSSTAYFRRWTEAVGGTIFVGSGLGLALSRS
jgi:threonine/homoserine/homoserine lactone efflux protein